MGKHFNVIQRLQEQLTECGDVAALIQPHAAGIAHDKQCSFQALEAQTQAYAHFFAQHGIDHHDQVLILLPPGPAFYAIFLGLMRIGATAVLVDPGVGIAHVRACLAIVKPSALIGIWQAQCLRVFPELRHLKKDKAFCPSCLPCTTRLKPEGASTRVFPAAEQHLALITFTSGSTGRPKAIVRTHGFLLRQGDAIASLLPAARNSVELCTFPVFTLANLAQGITTLLPPAGMRKLNKIDYPLLLKRIGQYRVNRILAAPDFCMNLAVHDQDGTGLHDIEHIHTGGGPVYLHLMETLRELAPSAEIMAIYGSTEAEPIAVQNLTMLAESDRQATAKGEGLLAGLPVGIIRLRIITDQTGSPIWTLTQSELDGMTLPAGQTGEIVVTGPLVQKSYMNPADNQETKFEVDGEIWHRTGDAGCLDSAGRLWLHGRCRAKIYIGGRFVYPFALEAAATRHRQIRRAAFVQVGKSNILALEGKDCPASIKTELLQNFPCLDRIICLEHIPVDKRHYSKVLYDELRQILSRR